MKRHFAMLAIALVSMGTLLVLFLQVSSSTPNQALAAAPGEEPVVTDVQPNAVPNDLDIPVVITGTGFAAVLSGTQVITPPLATLGDTALEDVIWVSTTTLSATVPWGMEPDVYTLTVQNPDGGTGFLAEAFTVTQGIGVWTTNGPYGGSITQLALHPVTPTIVYAFGQWVGLFVSDDAAAHWEMAALILSTERVDITFDAQDPAVMYTKGLRSMDGARTWERILDRPGGWSELVPVAHPTSPGVVFAAVSLLDFPGHQGGVLRSDDYGSTWITLTVGLTDTDFTSLAVHPALTQTMLAGTESGNLFYSLDGGQTWTWTTRLTDTVAALYFNPFEPLQAWATTPGAWGTPPSLYKSEDLVHWTLVNVQASSIGIRPWGWDMDFLTDTIWATWGGAYYSTDDGETWTRLASDTGPWFLAINPEDPQEMYGASWDRGVYKSDDGGLNWRQSNDGLAAVVPGGMMVSPFDPGTVYVRAGIDLIKSENGGRAWRVLGIEIGGSPAIGLAVDPFIPDRLYVNNMLSEDGGDTWRPMTFTIPITWQGGNSEISTIAPHPLVPGRILAGLVTGPPDIGLLYASEDYGEHWAYLGSTQPISYYTVIAYDAGDPNLIYADTVGSGLWKSTDGGQSWQARSLPGGESDIVALFTHPNIPNTVYATAGVNIPWGVARPYVSYDAAETWTALPEGRGAPVYFAPTEPPALYSPCPLNERTYLCRSWDGGFTWAGIIETPQGVETLAGGIDGERLILYVGGAGGSVSSVPGGLTLGTEPLGTIPGRGSLQGAGIYRLTLLPPKWVYLPLVLRTYAP